MFRKNDPAFAAVVTGTFKESVRDPGSF